MVEFLSSKPGGTGLVFEEQQWITCKDNMESVILYDENDIWSWDLDL